MIAGSVRDAVAGTLVEIVRTPLAYLAQISGPIQVDPPSIFYDPLPKPLVVGRTCPWARP